MVLPVMLQASAKDLIDQIKDRYIGKEYTPPTFVGTRNEWDEKSSSEKAKYELVILDPEDGEGESIVVDEVTSGNLNPVTSNAVKQAINELQVNSHFHIEASTIGLRPVVNVTFDNLIMAIYNTYGKGIFHISFVHSNAAVPTLLLPDGSQRPMSGAYMTGSIVDLDTIWQRSVGFIIIDLKVYMWNIETGASPTPVVTIKQITS